VTGDLIPKKSPSSDQVKLVFEYGSSYFIKNIISNCGLAKCLDNILPSYSSILQDYITFSVVETAPSYLFREWCESNLDLYKKPSSSQRVSELLAKIGDMENEREQFLLEWYNLNPCKESVFFDITSFSSYSDLIESVEWGHNRDHDNLPQINFGVLVGSPSYLPILYSIYPGSISDVTTLKNIAERINSLNIKHVTMILDRGFYSQNNLDSIYDCFDNFIIPMPFSNNHAKELLMGSKNISSYKNIFSMDNNRILYHEKKSIKIGNNELIANMYFDEKKRAFEIEKLERSLSEIEYETKRRSFKKEDDLKYYLKKNYLLYYKLFNIATIEGLIKILRNYDEINIRINKFGKMIFLSKSDLGKQMTIELYFKRDSVEQCFDNLKNDLKQDRIRVQSEKSMQGRLFISFITMIVFSFIQNGLNKMKHKKKMSMKQLMMNLKKLKMLKLLNGKTRLTEISRKQKNIFTFFDIPLPENKPPI
jgi:transposase